MNEGEAVGLIGPNGAGKTTTFNLITGFLRATSGAVIFEGKNLVGEKPHAIAAKGIVRTFQATSIFPGFTVLQNLVAACYLEPRIGFWEAALHRASSRKKERDVLDEAHEILRFVGLEQMKDLPGAEPAPRAQEDSWHRHGPCRSSETAPARRTPVRDE